MTPSRGSGKKYFEISGSGRVGSVRVRKLSNSHESGPVTVTRPDATQLDPRGLTRPVNRPAENRVYVCVGPGNRGKGTDAKKGAATPTVTAAATAAAADKGGLACGIDKRRQARKRCVYMLVFGEDGANGERTRNKQKQKGGVIDDGTHRKRHLLFTVRRDE